MQLSDFLKEQKPRLSNIFDKIWNEEFILNMVCPNCSKVNDMSISITMQSILITCSNKECNKKLFYRRINLGVIE